MDSFAEQLAGRLQADPNDAEAYAALKAHYNETGDVASLANLIEGWAAYQTDPVRASGGYLDAARVVGASGKHVERQRELLQKATQLDVANRDAVLELCSTYSGPDDAHALAEFLDKHLRVMEEQPHDPPLMAALYARLGALWSTTFERADVARRCFERALELDPTNAAISDAAHKIAIATNDNVFLARILGAEASGEDEPDRKLQIYLKQAELFVAESDFDSAVQALRAASNLAPADVAIMHRLASALSKRAAKSSGEDAARDLRRVAELHYQIAQAVAPDDAIPYLEAALGAVPSHDGALSMLEQLVQTFGRSELLPKYWLGYLATASEGPELDQRRVAMAKAYADADQLDDAIFCLEQVRTEGLAAPLLSELKAQRGPRSASQPPRTSSEDAEPLETQNRIDRPTAKVRPRTKSSERPLDIAPLLSELRRSLRDAIAARRTDEAVKHCIAILELEEGDAEAFALLESQYRKTRDHARLRELLLVSTQITGVPVDLRKQRLREVAAISEAKLKDVEGAIEVWRSVVALDPADSEASKSLKRLLQRTARWDELAAVLEHEALASQSPDDKVELLGQIAAIHRDKRKDLVEAAAALRQLLALRPDPGTRDELCDMLLSIDSYPEAALLLRARALEATGEREQLRLWRMLAETLEQKLADPEGAYEVYKRIREMRPKDNEVLERMQRIDEQSGNTLRLLETLERRTTLALRGERSALLTRMAELADEVLDDVDRAAGYYTKALELEPAREGVLDALSHMFERKERYADLAELLKAAVASEREPARRTELQLRRARVLRDSLSKTAEAADVYREVLTTQEHPEALEYLLETARQDEDPETVAALCSRLAALSGDVDTRRGLLYERAQVLVTELGRPRDAVRALREIVETIDPDFDPAIDWLAELCGNLDDKAGLATALLRRLAKTDDDETRIELAKRLSDLYEIELSDRDHAIIALLAWAKAAPQAVEPQRRLRPLLEAAGRFEELVATCDALADLETDLDARERATLDGASIAFTQLNDAAAAFAKLTPLVEDALPEALALLAVVARSSQQSEAMAALCVRAAQAAEAPDLQARLWSAAVRTYTEDLNDPLQALEAALRLLATNLKSREHLTQVEDSAALANAWTRLAPVYDRLLKSADDDAERIELLSRYAELLDTRANNPSDALDRILHACTLAPNDENLMARAERLATRSRRGAALLALCEHQALQLGTAPAKVEWLLRASRFAVSTLRDRERAGAYLGAALAATLAESELWEQVVRAAGQLDATHDEGEPHAMLRGLIQSHRQLAESIPAPIGSTLILRASRLLHDRLDDERGAFDLLRQGSLLFPLEEDVYDALFARAEALGRFDALDAHLARAIDEAMDPKSAAALVSRRARLLEGPLGRPQDAADVFAKLLQLRPDDTQAAAKLRDSLRRARRFQDLLLVIHKQMQRVKNAAEKLELLKESAQVWELDLKNRWEALDAWRKVVEFAPGDAEGRRAVLRLERRSLLPSAADESAAEHDAESDAPTSSETPTASATRVPSAVETRTADSAANAVQEATVDYAALNAQVVPIDTTTPANDAVPPTAASAALAAAPDSASASASAQPAATPTYDELPSSEITAIDEAQLGADAEEVSVDIELQSDRAPAPVSRIRRSTAPPPPPPQALRAPSVAPSAQLDAATPSQPPPLPAAVRNTSAPDTSAKRSPSLPPPVPPRKN